MLVRQREFTLTSLRLVIHSYTGLLPQNIATDQDLKTIDQLICRIPSYGEQAAAWADLALRCRLQGQDSLCNQIVTEHVRPAFSNIPIQDGEHRLSIAAFVAPALYCEHRRTTFELIERLPQPFHDFAYQAICQFILSRRPPFDPYDSIPQQAYKVTINELVDICEIMEQIEHDGLIFSLIKECNTMTDPSSKLVYFNASQKAYNICRTSRVFSSE